MKQVIVGNAENTNAKADRSVTQMPKQVLSEGLDFGKDISHKELKQPVIITFSPKSLFSVRERYKFISFEQTRRPSTKT